MNVNDDADIEQFDFNFDLPLNQYCLVPNNNIDVESQIEGIRYFKNKTQGKDIRTHQQIELATCIDS